MFVVRAQNVRDALPKAANYLMKFGKKESTRIGPAIVATRPVAIVYQYPKEHVLLNKIRDANPFFHLMEAMWMLAGRNDSAFLDHYISDFSVRFASNGVVEDAYGHRWRHSLQFDQLEEIVMQLKKNPETRQAVLQMWGAGRPDLLADISKPCNLVATFRIHEGQLNMTVFNRSNDLIWGCCGANAVHFAILQEYLAAKIGVKLGEYVQISNNLHLYEEHIEKFYKRMGPNLGRSGLSHQLRDTNDYGMTQPLIDDIQAFDPDLQETMDCIDSIQATGDGYDGNIASSFLRDTVISMARAHWKFKNSSKADALAQIYTVSAQDWRQAGTEWIERRKDKVA